MERWIYAPPPGTGHPPPTQTSPVVNHDRGRRGYPVSRPGRPWVQPAEEAVSAHQLAQPGAQFDENQWVSALFELGAQLFEHFCRGDVNVGDSLALQHDPSDVLIGRQGSRQYLYSSIDEALAAIDAYVPPEPNPNTGLQTDERDSR